MAKSDLHIELSRRPLVWLGNKATQRGVRGTEEVIISEGYVVDAAAICGLSIASEKLFLGKCERGQYDKISDDYSFVFESKVSRADFFNTFKHGNHKGDRLTAVANFHFVVAPKGLIAANEVPAFWGLLEKSGQGLSLTKLAEYVPLEPQDLHEMAYKILRATSHFKFNYYSDLVDEYKKTERQ